MYDEAELDEFEHKMASAPTATAAAGSGAVPGGGQAPGQAVAAVKQEPSFIKQEPMLQVRGLSLSHSSGAAYCQL